MTPSVFLLLVSVNFSLMTACRAVVQRMLLESLGLVAPPAGRGTVLRRRLPSGEVLWALKHLLA